MQRVLKLSGLLVLVALAALAATASAADKLKAGEEGKLEVPGNSHPCVIYIPKDYKDGMNLPLILFLHGAGGSPTTWPFKDATRGEGYIIVGLSYGSLPDAGGGGISADPKSEQGMIDFINQVRGIVKTTYGINDKQVFLTGLSMGGWGVNYYGFNKKAKGLYRGYCIIAAGPVGERGVDLTVAKDLPVLVVNGDKDPNLKAANEGKPAAEKAGAIVTQVVLPGQPHVPSNESMDEPLRKWLEDNGPLKETLAGIEKAKEAEKTSLGAAMALYETALTASGASSNQQIKDAREHYDKLAATAKADLDAALALAEQKKYGPCAAALEKISTTYRGHETAQKAEKKIQELRADPAVQKIVAQEQANASGDRALAAAMEKVQAKDYPKAVELLNQLVAQFPGTDAATKAAAQLKALNDDPKIVTALEEATAGKACRALLSRAENFHKNGMKPEAVECLNEITQKFPKSTWAKDAERLKGEW